ncbi:S-layer homology domain-containing protein, partial [Frankia sp. Cpl3]|nr:S-layer homology domain-containing protein [Frankia sp. Cpl3]
GKEIREMTQAGVVQGFPDGTFRPNALVTEEQFFSMVERLLPPIADHQFDSFVAETYLSKVQNRWSEPVYKKLMVAGITTYG